MTDPLVADLINRTMVVSEAMDRPDEIDEEAALAAKFEASRRLSAVLSAARLLAEVHRRAPSMPIPPFLADDIASALAAADGGR